MSKFAREEYKTWILQLRKSKKLHSRVEDRLIELLSKITPDYYPVKEPVGLAGGRNDLMIFEYTGRKVLFEIFATKSQVSRDLRILDKTNADVKIAVVMDKDVDPSIHDAFLKENPESNYPFIFIKELFEEPQLKCQLKLRELILGDEEAKLLRILKANMPSSDFFLLCQNEGIEVISKEGLASGHISFMQIFVTLVLSKCLKFGIERKRILNLGRWLSDQNLVKYVLARVAIGLNIVLYTDFIETFALYADFELTDWIRASYLIPEPSFMLSLTAVLREIEAKYITSTEKLLSKEHMSIFVGKSEVHEMKSGERTVIVSLPRTVESIVLVVSSQDRRNEDDYREMVQFVKPEPGHITEIEIG